MTRLEPRGIIAGRTAENGRRGRIARLSIPLARRYEDRLATIEAEVAKARYFPGLADRRLS